MSRADLDLTMTLADALHQGLVMRTSPVFLCGSMSPESQAHCLLDPDHAGAHLGRPDILTIQWA